MERTYINQLYLSCQDTDLLNTIVERIKKTFECYFVDDFGEYSYEIEFGTSCIPKEELEEIIRKIKGKECNIWVFTHDNSRKYYGFHIYQDGQWSILESNKKV